VTEGGSIRVGILTVSDSVSAGEREDVSGGRIAEWVDAAGWRTAARASVPDETVPISSALLDWCDRDLCDLLITTGGTGLTARDVTPEATRAVAEREVPGLAEALRAAGRSRTAFAAIGRGLAAVRGRTLIVNLPGSPSAVAEGLAVIAEVVPHAVELLRGNAARHD
jgi:molybdopterin adenylyltransferase